MIELALMLSLLVALTMLVVDFGRAFMIENLVTQAAREGARRAAVSAPADGVVAITRAVGAAGGSPVNGVTITTAPVGDGSGEGDRHGRVHLAAPRPPQDDEHHGGQQRNAHCVMHHVFGTDRTLGQGRKGL